MDKIELLIIIRFRQSIIRANDNDIIDGAKCCTIVKKKNHDDHSIRDDCLLFCQ